MLYAIETIAALIGARREGDRDARIDRLLTDSRSLAFPETTLFFALRTKVGDGADYINELYRCGVRNFVVAELSVDLKAQCPEANFLIVTNPLKALQRLAERHREEYDVPVVGVTGSNGKTVVKEWLYQLLSPAGHVTRSPRSYNSQIGVPLSVWLLDERTRLAVFEAGISRPDEMASLRAMIQPTIGVITNLGPAHQENFCSISEKGLEKVSLFKDAEVIIYSEDDDTIQECVDEIAPRAKRLAWSRRNTRSALYVQEVVSNGNETEISYIYNQEQGRFTIPFTDAASVENAITCLAVCCYLELAPSEIARRMALLGPVAMRLEVTQGVEDCTLINDAYNSDLASLDIALDFLSRRAEAAGREKVVVLSDILQTGLPAERVYTRVAETIEKRGISRLIAIGSELGRMKRCFDGVKAKFYATTEEYLSTLTLSELSGRIVLVKGARCFGFERIIAALSERIHETTLNVDLEAIRANLNYYRSFLRPGVKTTCMIKASGYGAGAVEIAKTLQEAGADYLAVAVADEGVALRKAGISAGIIVMNPEMSSFDTLFAYRLEPEVYSFKLLDALAQAGRKQGVQHFPIHIKLDTGMHRLGFNPLTDVPVLIDRLSRQATLTPRSVFSHFVGADSPDFDDFSARQFRLFDEASRTLATAFPHQIIRHICNSAGIERFPERHLDMVRLGLGLYGIDPIDNRLLCPAASLVTTILQIREVAAGESVGYSRKTVLDRPSRIAAIPIGYADGLNRRLGNRAGYCLVGGKKAPYVGNICMDVAMIDVTDINCREGDKVEIFGEHLPASHLADLIGTIPYEVLTSVSERVKRVYLGG